MKRFSTDEARQKTFIIDEPTVCKRMILVLDESGSMATQKSDIVGGINEMIRSQRELEPENNENVFFNIVKFNSVVSPVRNETLKSIRNFTDYDYRPSGSTALYDAIGKTINQFKNEKDVIMIIATDGQENASRTYRKPEVVRMIAEQKEVKDWDFVYLSEDIDTFEEGTRLGFVNGSKGCYNQCLDSDQLGKAMQTECYNVNISNLRQKKKADFSSLSSTSSFPTSSFQTSSYKPSTRSYRVNVTPRTPTPKGFSPSPYSFW